MRALARSGIAKWNMVALGIALGVFVSAVLHLPHVRVCIGTMKVLSR